MTWRAPSLERVLEMTDDDEFACCNQCKQALTGIDCYGKHSTGCMTCNIWWSLDGAKVRLPEEDLRAL
jgi:hypothetical protein